jgi:hypothetical protein
MKKLLVSFFVACVSGTAIAESYLCISEAAGGVFYGNGRWDDGKMSIGKKFLFKGNAWYEFGSSNPQVIGCKKVEDRFSGSFVECQDEFYHIRFNKKNLRYSRFYLFGFVDGKDNAGNTPHVEIGKCSRID